MFLPIADLQCIVVVKHQLTVTLESKLVLEYTMQKKYPSKILALRGSIFSRFSLDLMTGKQCGL